jgi:hypothetical protein
MQSRRAIQDATGRCRTGSRRAATAASPADLTPTRAVSGASRRAFGDRPMIGRQGLRHALALLRSLLTTVGPRRELLRLRELLPFPHGASPCGHCIATQLLHYAPSSPLDVGLGCEGTIVLVLCAIYAYSSSNLIKVVRAGAPSAFRRCSVRGCRLLSRLLLPHSCHRCVGAAAGAVTWRRFVSCMELLPRDEAQPFWRAAHTQAAAMIAR